MFGILKNIYQVKAPQKNISFNFENKITVDEPENYQINLYRSIRTWRRCNAL